MIKYCTKSSQIEACNVLRETDKMVFLPRSWGDGETKQLKRSDYQNWHDTFEDAQQFLIDNAQSEIDRLRGQIEYVENKLEKIKAMKEK